MLPKENRAYLRLEFPREVIKSAMLKVDRICLENAIEQIKQTDNVRNYER